MRNIDAFYKTREFYETRCFFAKLFLTACHLLPAIPDYVRRDASFSAARRQLRLRRQQLPSAERDHRNHVLRGRTVDTTTDHRRN